MIDEKELEEYFKKYIDPIVTQEFIERAMLIPYLPKEILRERYGEDAEPIIRIFQGED